MIVIDFGESPTGRVVITLRSLIELIELVEGINYRKTYLEDNHDIRTKYINKRREVIPESNSIWLIMEH